VAPSRPPSSSRSSGVVLSDGKTSQIPPAHARARLPWLAAGLVMALLTAALLRSWLMTDYLDYDESQIYLVAVSPLWADFEREFRNRTHPPLSYLAMKPFLALSHEAWAVKALSLLSGLAAIPIIQLALNQRLSPGAALLGAVVISTTPDFVWQSIEARHYSLCLLLVWLSLLVYLRLAGDPAPRLADHARLACILLLVLVTEYLAMPHVAAVAVLAAAPDAWRHLRAGRWRRAVAVVGIYAGTLGLTAALFAWQFQGRIPSRHPHTIPFMYGGSLLDLRAMLGFLTTRWLAFADSLLPSPWGVLLLVLLVAPWTGLLRDDPSRRLARRLSLGAALALGFSSVAALLGHLPLGGRPRHMIATVPLVLLADTFILAGLVGRLPRPAWRVAASAVVAGGFLIGSAVGLRAGANRSSEYAELVHTAGLGDYSQRPAAIVADRRGRNLVSWWLLRGREPRLVSASVEGCLNFTYGDTRVAECDGDALVIRAGELARAEGRAWIVMTDQTNAMRLSDAMQRALAALAASPDIEVRSGPVAPWLRYIAVAEVQRAPRGQKQVRSE